MHLWGILCKDDGKDSILLFYCTVHLETNILHVLKNPYNILPLQVCSILLVLLSAGSVDFSLKSRTYKNPARLMGFADWICHVRFGPGFICGPCTWGSFHLPRWKAALLPLWYAISSELEMWDLGASWKVQPAAKTLLTVKNKMMRYWCGI